MIENRLKPLYRDIVIAKPSTSIFSSCLFIRGEICRDYQEAAGMLPLRSVRLQLHTLAYNLANFLRTLALPEEIEHWSLTTLREMLVKIGARIVRHGRYVVFQLAEVAVPRALFADILSRIERCRAEVPLLMA
jgi:Transposase DDE domain group 1